MSLLPDSVLNDSPFLSAWQEWGANNDKRDPISLSFFAASALCCLPQLPKVAPSAGVFSI